ncbi:c-type cytochrome [Octadecabacter sp. SW4]|uniref:cytochrome c n=1 Tax=Octadecabacter sp. SW4 TaxID=2602067 RepID=UPI0011C1D48F|nr:cytochrome c [Octadecabacter sp. SW4]QEE35612.1 c-type cytochrome [Octadecabacter sp. SW4]
MRVIRAGFVLAIIGGAVAWFATRPASLDPALLAGLQGDATRGALVFAAAGCAACHTAPDSDPSDRPVLAGGRAFPSDFGRFIAPNISPDPSAGIGAWSDYDLANAIMRGVGPEGAHYYPAFPYTTYAKADPQDIVDLIAHLRTLPASDVENQPHDVGFPFNIRRMLGGWKLLFSTDAWALADPLPDDVARGRYLVEALGHCSECHTARNVLGGLRRAQWLAGAPNPSGEGTIPNITPAALSWSAGDIVEYLTSGFTPEFDTAGGEMVDVIANTARLPESDRAAIAAYLKAVPAVE